MVTELCEAGEFIIFFLFHSMHCHACSVGPGRAPNPNPLPITVILFHSQGVVSIPGEC